MCAVAGIIEEAERRAGPGRLTLRLQELGGLVRIASDIAVIEGASLAGASHVERTLAMALSKRRGTVEWRRQFFDSD